MIFLFLYHLEIGADLRAVILFQPIAWASAANTKKDQWPTDRPG